MNWYLKYRPKNINELGLKSVRLLLSKLLAGPEYPHAFLLAGPRGLGKTSTARIIAQYVNCLQPKDVGVPCGQCQACRLFKEHQTIDVIEMDAASNRSVEDIRQLRSEVGLAPSRLKYKVYIIDEVHMLTNEAFNALLKTLEEPPKHVIFILATTEIHKIPETIKSRCQIIEYQLATIDELVETLKRVVKGEKLEVDEPTLRLIAQKGRGSFRDAIKLLEKLAGSGRINSQLLREFRSTTELVDSLFQALIDIKIPKAIEILNKLEENNYSPMELIYELELRFSQVLSQYAKLRSERLRFYKKIIRLLLEASAFTKEPISTYLQLKVFLIELSQKNNNEGYLEEVNQVESKKRLSSSLSSDKTDKKEKDKDSKKNEGSTLQKDNLDNGCLQKIKEFWSKLIEDSLSLNHGLKNILSLSRLVKVENGLLYLEVATSFEKELVEKSKVRRWLEDYLTENCRHRLGLMVGVNQQLREQRSKTLKEKKPLNDDRLDILMK